MANPLDKESVSPTWARTRDLRINSPSLYQLSYRGSELNILAFSPQRVNRLGDFCLPYQLLNSNARLRKYGALARMSQVAIEVAVLGDQTANQLGKDGDDVGIELFAASTSDLVEGARARPCNLIWTSMS